MLCCSGNGCSELAETMHYCIGILTKSQSRNPLSSQRFQTFDFSVYYGRGYKIKFLPKLKLWTVAIQSKSTKTIKCIDCGKEFEVKIKDTKSCRCKECQGKLDKEKTRIRVQNYRKSKM